MRVTLKIHTKRGTWKISPLCIHKTSDGRIWTANYAGSFILDYEACFFNKKERGVLGRPIDNGAVPTWIRRKINSWLREMLRMRYAP